MVVKWDPEGEIDLRLRSVEDMGCPPCQENICPCVNRAQGSSTSPIYFPDRRGGPWFGLKRPSFLKAPQLVIHRDFGCVFCRKSFVRVADPTKILAGRNYLAGSAAAESLCFLLDASVFL